MRLNDYDIDINMFAPCGMNCKVCYKHCYLKNPCAGCLNSDKGKPEHCRKCKIKDCVKSKEIIYCYECFEYSFKFVKNLEESFSKRYQARLIKHSVLVNEHGLKVFIKEQKEKYIYTKCQGILSIHDREFCECQESM